MADEARRSGDGKLHLPVVDGPLRDDLDDGLRFVHVMGMQIKHELFQTSAQLKAILEELVARGGLDLRSFEARRERIRARELERHSKQVFVQIADTENKYGAALPDVDCESILPICKARCCTLAFPLSVEDLDEGVAEWDYAAPYMIRQAKDGKCVHNDRETGHCTVYEKRPAVCRTYDCRKDRRIWADFERRILAPVTSPATPARP